MTETPPWREDDNGAFTATFKGGAGYDEPWLVIRAYSSEVLRVRIINAFGLEDSLTLPQAIVRAKYAFAGMNASVEEQAVASLKESFGQVDKIADVEGDPSTSNAKAGDEVWIAAAARAAENKQVDPDKRLLDEIEAATTVDQLKRCWVENNPFSGVVEAAWRARGKALQGGSK